MGTTSVHTIPPCHTRPVRKTTVSIIVLASVALLALMPAIGVGQVPPSQSATPSAPRLDTWFTEVPLVTGSGYMGYPGYPSSPGYPMYPGYPSSPGYPMYPGYPSYPGYPMYPGYPGYPGVPPTYPGVAPPVTGPVQPQPEGPGAEGMQGEEPAEGVAAEEEEVEEGAAVEERIPLPLFGHDLFAVAPYEPLRRATAPPPPSYVLAVGDTVELAVWGRGNQYVNTRQIVGTDGSVYADPVGQISLAGKTIGDCQSSLLASFRRYFPECSVSLTVTQLHSIEVQAAGNVVRPGRVTLPGTATVFMALYAVGGPTVTGSLRAVDVRRGTELVETVDLYDFLLRGDTSSDITLQGGDTVFVPVVSGLVEVRGEVGRQACYEIGDSATLAEALDMSGGLRGSAYAKRIQLIRSDRNTERVVLEADLVDEPERWRGLELQDGDEVVVLPVLDELRNVVSVEGEVRRPGKYALAEGMTVSQLLKQAQDLTPQAARKFAHVVRESPEGLPELVRVNLAAAIAGDAAADARLQPRDTLRVYSARETELLVVCAEGAVVTPDEYDWYPGMTVSDLARLAGGLTNDAYGESAVLVRKTADMEDQFITVPLGRVLDGAESEDVLLEPRDRLVVSLRKEKGRPKLVEISGAVVDPEEYPLGAGMKVSDLINMAGGLLPEASGAATIIHGQTASLAEFEELDVSSMKRGEPPDPDPVLVEGDTVAIQGQGGFKTNAEVVGVIGQVANPDVFPLRRGPDGRLMRLSELLEEAGGLLPTAYPEMAAVYHTEESLAAREGRVRTIKTALQESSSAEAPEEAGGGNGDATYSAVDKGVRVEKGAASRGLVQVLSGAEGEAHIIIPPRALARIKVSNSVPVDLGRVLRDPDGPADLELQDGDILAVFEKPDTVMVDGAVAAPGPQPFVEGAVVGDYIWEAGGQTRDADMKHAVIVNYNGRAAHAKRGEKIRAGDWIIVPPKYTTQSVGRRSTFEEVFGRVVEALSTFLLFRKL